QLIYLYRYPAILFAKHRCESLESLDKSHKGAATNDNPSKRRYTNLRNCCHPRDLRVNTRLLDLPLPPQNRNQNDHCCQHNHHHLRRQCRCCNHCGWNANRNHLQVDC
ncbi:unnamed protein product, partial [Oikopleura dioica]